MSNACMTALRWGVRYSSLGHFLANATLRVLVPTLSRTHCRLRKTGKLGQDGSPKTVSAGLWLAPPRIVWKIEVFIELLPIENAVG